MEKYFEFKYLTEMVSYGIGLLVLAFIVIVWVIDKWLGWE